MAEQPSCRVRTLVIATPDLIRGNQSSFSSVRGLDCFVAALLAMTSMRLLPVIMFKAIVGQRTQILDLAEIGGALEGADADVAVLEADQHRGTCRRSEEHTSELQSLMRI